MRNNEKDSAGNPNPVPGLTHALCQGISSSGMYLRDFTYQGFNVDEADRMACDGMHIHVAGAHKLFLNYRFAQPNPYSQQHRERYVPDVNFRASIRCESIPSCGFRMGILKRPLFDRKIIHTDTSNEYWQIVPRLAHRRQRRRDHGLQRIEQSAPLPVVELAARRLQGRGAASAASATGSACIPPTRCTPARCCGRWSWHWNNGVKDDAEPPAMRVPRIADQTLVEPDALLLPAIPGLEYKGLHNGSGDRDFGPRVRFNRGVIDLLLPEVIARHKVTVPQVDNIGNEIAGIRHPFVEAPTATLLGWNTRTPEFGGPDLCDLLGSTISLPKTKAEAEASNDPRPSLEELYGNHAGYVAKVAEAAKKLQEDKLLLPEDVEDRIAEAKRLRTRATTTGQCVSRGLDPA